jgi:bacteriocin-like protein
MSIQKKPGSKPDDLIASKIKGGEIELTENELDNVSGGAGSDFLLTLDGIKGESQDDKHKDTIEITSIKKGK